MGVPAFFRWISNKYPKIISPVVEDNSDFDNPNPNGELDNLYLDMNGIVHPCSHPENKPPPENEAQMMLDIFKYTDRLIKMARPRKVLMIAIDGVAPRAKMNQQRSRRFRSARDARIKKEQIEKEMDYKRSSEILKGKIIDDSVKSDHVHWDSNAITPGTPFMDILASSLRYWVAYKLSHDDDWANLQVILSDSSVPGEGEHKIMNFIRSQRLDPQYNPNTTHSIYGLDADLIFLGLATHEPHFRILREDVFAKFSQGSNNRNLSLQEQMFMSEEEKKEIKRKESEKPFLWLNTHILREYLKVELMTGIQIPQLHRNLDFERCLDDWIFLCFFIGNDFLPSIPSISVRDNSIDMLVQLWKQNLPYLFNNKKKFNNDYYLTRDGEINLPAVEVLLKSLAAMEDGILRKKHSQEVAQAEFEKRKKVMRDQNKNSVYKGYKLNEDKQFVNQATEANQNMALYSVSDNKIINNVSAKGAKDLIKDQSIVKSKQTLTLEESNKKSQSAAAALRERLATNSKKRKLEETETEATTEDASEEPESKQAAITQGKDSYDPSETTGDDEKIAYEVPNSQTGKTYDNYDLIRVWEPGYSNRYYKIKFNLVDDEQVLPFKKQLLYHYLEGISWVLLYYYQGCPSWNWYYPYHYAPFASDFGCLDFQKDVKIKFDEGTPFRPFEQLMSVLPADSSHNLPEVFHDLMKNADSEIIEYYPEHFDIDMNGSKMPWHGVPLLPFINEKKLLHHVSSKYDLLTEAESFRNQNRSELILISKKNKWYKTWAKELFEEGKDKISFGAKKTNISGIVAKSPEYDFVGSTEFPLYENCEDNPFPDTINNQLFIKVGYDFYSNVDGKRNKSMILNGYIDPIQVLTQDDKNAILYGGQGYAVRQKKGFTHQQNTHINFAITVGPPKGKINIYHNRPGGYLGLLRSNEQRQIHERQLNSGVDLYSQMQQHNFQNPVPGPGYNGGPVHGGPVHGGPVHGGPGYGGPGYGGPGYNNFNQGRGGFNGRGRGNGFNNRGRGGYNNRGGYNPRGRGNLTGGPHRQGYLPPNNQRHF
ncbi:ssRNA exonuclease [Saccharomycopsis crataegensis]|uniref:5'-3' exoribonuclease n=1 Tax=Saccharomycopsis crataegensis TaxID=43959 RepID=A0AAV5QG07_9ASCO|nr:ssRNA exonuclease [Saccharomycopsis crataegensis]